MAKFDVVIAAKTVGEQGIKRLGNSMQGVKGKVKNLKIAAIKKEERKKEEAKEIDKFKKKCKKLIKKHKYALAIDRKKYFKKNQYGIEEDKGWSLDFDFGKKI